MKNTAIIADSTCDLSAELIERYHITIVPLHILLNETEYLDGIDITPSQIYAWAEENKSTPRTSAVSVTDVCEALKKVFLEAEEAVCFCISESMSASGEIMRVAATEMEASDRVFVIDSQNLSTGIGLQVIEAAIMAEKGLRGAEIVAEIEKIRPLVQASFVVDTLTYLHRGGRCSGLSAMAGSALKLHPLIEVKDGAMVAGKKYRGQMDKVILSYVNDLMPALRTARTDRVFLTHSGCEEDIVARVRDQLEALNRFDEILITVAGGVISSHCGPGTLGVLFIASEET